MPQVRGVEPLCREPCGGDARRWCFIPRCQELNGWLWWMDRLVVEERLSQGMTGRQRDLV